MKKMLFIFNPHTGGGKLKSALMELLVLFSSAGYSLSVWPTKGAGDAQEITASAAKQHDLVVCCGGDGTLNEVVNGLRGLDNAPPLGYIPGGTTCDFAASLGLPRGNVMAAGRRIVNSEEFFACDIGEINERAFTYVAAFGAFTDVSYETSQKSKNALGYLAYLLEGMQRLPKLEACHARVCCEGEVLEDNYLLGMVSNSVTVGGLPFLLQQEVHMNDGIFELILIKSPNNIAEFREMTTALLAGNIDSPLIRVCRVKKAEFSFEKETAWTLDGEFGGRFQHSLMEVCPRAIRLCV